MGEDENGIVIEHVTDATGVPQFAFGLVKAKTHIAKGGAADSTVVAADKGPTTDAGRVDKGTADSTPDRGVADASGRC